MSTVVLPVEVPDVSCTGPGCAPDHMTVALDFSGAAPSPTIADPSRWVATGTSVPTGWASFTRNVDGSVFWRCPTCIAGGFNP